MYKGLKLSMVLLFIFVGCRTSKINNSIPYILPRKVEHKLYKIVKEKPESRFSFYLSQKDNNIFEITVSESKNNFEEIDNFNYIKKSNRKVLINDKFYPLVFASDYLFGTDMNQTEQKTLLERDKMDEKGRSREGKDSDFFVLRRSYTVFEGYSITFDHKGNILNE